jgi:hypothetical protein
VISIAKAEALIISELAKAISLQIGFDSRMVFTPVLITA